EAPPRLGVPDLAGSKRAGHAGFPLRVRPATRLDTPFAVPGRQTIEMDVGLGELRSEVFREPALPTRTVACLNNHASKIDQQRLRPDQPAHVFLLISHYLVFDSRQPVDTQELPDSSLEYNAWCHRTETH